MGADDKLENAGQDLKGKAKEAAGKLSERPSLRPRRR